MSDENVFYGTVIWFDAKRGFGFISWEKDGASQKDIFVHFSDIVCEGFKTLNKNYKVSFKIGTNNRGEPKAVEVTALKN